jgi:hypothetical protein
MGRVLREARQANPPCCTQASWCSGVAAWVGAHLQTWNVHASAGAFFAVVHATPQHMH